MLDRKRQKLRQSSTYVLVRRTVAPRWSIRFIFRFSILMGRDRCHGLLAIGVSTLPYRKHKHARTELAGHFYVRQNKTKGIRRIEAEPRVLSRNLGRVIKDHRNESFFLNIFACHTFNARIILKSNLRLVQSVSLEYRVNMLRKCCPIH